MVCWTDILSSSALEVQIPAVSDRLNTPFIWTGEWPPRWFGIATSPLRPTQIPIKEKMFTAQMIPDKSVFKQCHLDRRPNQMWTASHRTVSHGFRPGPAVPRPGSPDGASIRALAGLTDGAAKRAILSSAGVHLRNVNSNP
jgi:hypothetical protein